MKEVMGMMAQEEIVMVSKGGRGPTEARSKEESGVLLYCCFVRWTRPS
jgi:hypothetical protein